MNKKYNYLYKKNLECELDLKEILNLNKLEEERCLQNFITIKKALLINGLITPDIYMLPISMRRQHRKKLNTFDFYEIINKNNKIIIQCISYTKKKSFQKTNTKKLFEIVLPNHGKKTKNLRNRYIDVKKRLAVFERDIYTCQYCGWKNGTNKGDRVLHIDHRIPVYFGGTNKINNLTTACYKCNTSKNNKILEWENN